MTTREIVALQNKNNVLIGNNEIIVPLDPENPSAIGYFLGIQKLLVYLSNNGFKDVFDGTVDYSTNATAIYTTLQKQQIAFNLVNSFYNAYISKETDKFMVETSNMDFDDAKLLAGLRNDLIIPFGIYSSVPAAARIGWTQSPNPNTWPGIAAFPQITFATSSAFMRSQGVPEALIFGLNMLRGFNSFDLKQPGDIHRIQASQQFMQVNLAKQPNINDTIDVLNYKAHLLGYSSFAQSIESLQSAKLKAFDKAAVTRKNINSLVIPKLSGRMLDLVQKDLNDGNYTSVISAIINHSSTQQFDAAMFRSTISQMSYRPDLNQTMSDHFDNLKMWLVALYSLIQSKLDRTIYPAIHDLTTAEIQSAIMLDDASFNLVYAQQNVSQPNFVATRKTLQCIQNSEKTDHLFKTVQGTFLSKFVSKIQPQARNHQPGYDFAACAQMLIVHQDTQAFKYGSTLQIPDTEANDKRLHQAYLASSQPEPSFSSYTMHDKYALAAAMPVTKVNFTESNTRFNARSLSPSRSSSSSDKTYYPRGLSPSRTSRSFSPQRRSSSPSPGSASNRHRRPASPDRAARPDEGRKRGASPSFSSQGSSSRRRDSSPTRPASPSKAAGRPTSPKK